MLPANSADGLHLDPDREITFDSPEAEITDEVGHQKHRVDIGRQHLRFDPSLAALCAVTNPFVTATFGAVRKGEAVPKGP